MLLALLIAKTSIMLLIAPWGAMVAAVVTLLGMVYRTRGFVSGNELQGQLEQKDAIIHTNEQTIESIRTRLQILEQDLDHMTRDRTAETLRINELTTKLEILQQYSSPEVVKRFEETLAAHRREVAERHERMLRQLDAQTSGMQRVTAALERMEKRLDTNGSSS